MTRTRHVLRMLGVAAVASLAISAVAASGAQAHVWAINGVDLANGASEKCSAEFESGTVGTLTSTVAGLPFKITSTTLTSHDCTIKQNGAVAEDTVEKLTFSGLSIDEPAGCSVNSPITTAAIESKIITADTPARTFMTFKPESGTLFANIVLTGCAAAETYPVRGSVCAEIDQANSFTTSQPLDFTPTADSACTSDALTLGGKTATLRAHVTIKLAGGPKADEIFGYTP